MSDPKLIVLCFDALEKKIIETGAYNNLRAREKIFYLIFSIKIIE